MKSVFGLKSTNNKRSYNRLKYLPIIAALVFTVSCGKKGDEQKGPPPQAVAPVLTATVTEKDVPVELRAVGAVEAYSTVSIKSQAGGYLQKINFQEGQDVKSGDLLFVIDPKPYVAELRQAQANLAKDVAQLENAQKIFERDKVLLQTNNVSQEEYDQAQANVAGLKNSVEADKASVENARIRLSYCYLHAPLSGRAGSVLIHKGNLITANADKPLVVINQLQPIFVSFSIPAQYLNEIKKRMAAEKLSVEATTHQSEVSVQNGELIFIDNEVDATTGTIRLKATFDNAGLVLWPGDFVNVVLRLSTRKGVLTTPSQAVMTGQNGQYVFVVKKDKTVEIRDVVSDYELDGYAVIEKGLSAGEQVVTDGQLRLKAGSKVSFKTDSQNR